MLYQKQFYQKEVEMDIEDIAKKDLTINLRHVMDFGDVEFRAEILNTHETVNSVFEYVKIAGRYV